MKLVTTTVVQLINYTSLFVNIYLSIHMKLEKHISLSEWLVKLMKYEVKF